MSEYSSGTLENLCISESNGKSSLTPQGSITSSYSSMCAALGSAIATTHNAWQSSASIDNILVTGGTCSPQGPLVGGIGFGAPGSISGRVSGTVGELLSLFPTNAMADRTDALTSHMTSVAEAWEETFNSFLDTAVIQNILVSQGTCSCRIVVPIGPIPGSYSGGEGVLPSLTGFVTGSPVTQEVMRALAISKMDSTILAKGTPTQALSDSLDAIFKAIQDNHESWLQGTSIENLKVDGGFTFPGAPIVGAVGSGGEFI